jgi:hypothetical protein
VGISYGSCQRVLTEELGMNHVAAKFVPRIVTLPQTLARKDLAASP